MAAAIGIAVAAGLAVGCGSSGGGGSSGPARDDTKAAGTFTIAVLGVEDMTTYWDAWGGYHGLEFDGSGTVDLDEDVDGNYDDGSMAYAVYADGTMVIDTVCQGIMNADEDTAVLTDSELSVDTEINLILAVRDSSGMTAADFTGDYISCQFGIDTSDDSHWTTRLSTTGNGAAGDIDFTILSDSNGDSGTGTVDFTIADSGRLTQTTDSEYGMLRSDAEFWFLTDEDDSDDDINIIVSVKKGSGLDASILQGTYIVAQIRGEDDDAGDRNFSISRLQITSDGAGNASYEVLSDSSGGAGETGTTTYTVAADGSLVITGLAEGIVSSDGSIFVVVDTDWNPGASDDEVQMMIGIKKQ